jgi:outer membrane immunogenic protein
MKTLCALTLLLFALTLPKAVAQNTTQNTSSVDVAAGYTYIHSNAPPSGCGCFNFNGGSASVAWRLDANFSLLAEVAGAHAGNIDGSGISPTLTTYLFGPRYYVTKGSHHIVPFGNLLLGVAHETNGYFPDSPVADTTASVFAMSVGGGIDVPVGHRFSIRPVEAEYLLTKFPNGVNSRQNNIRLTSGIVLHFGKR